MDRRVQMAVALMEENLHQEWTLDELARHVNLSPSRFRHLFKLETGTSPARHLKTLRIRRAKTLLETTFLNIKEIMNKVGLKDKSHFTQDFKRAYGLPPVKYRMSHFTAAPRRELWAVKAANE